MDRYFAELNNGIDEAYRIAGAARAIGFDPVSEVEVPRANSLAERVVGLISVLYPQIVDDRIIKRILALEKQYGSLEPAVALTIAAEVAKENYCKFASHIEAIEAGIRVAIAYLTLGYVSSPIEGFIQLKIKKTADDKDYFAVYFSGPIRSAGGTEAGFALVAADYLRELLGYSLYDPTEDEVKRGVHECYEYHERITNLQYLPSEREIAFLMENLPVQLTGDPSEDREVYNYKDLPRIETNFIRSGFALVLGEGMAQKAPKILKRILKLKQQGFQLSNWEWLSDFINLQKKIKEEKKSAGGRTGATYMQDLVAGRPVFAHPSRSGAFRLRYGRSRNTGYSTLAVHPATMGITGDFIAVGTQLKIEKPTKGCTLAVCDSIRGPIVKMQDESVFNVKTLAEARSIYKNVKEILYLGDLLVPYGDFLNRNHLLEPAGYSEEQWLAELQAKGGKSNLHPIFKEAVELSGQYGIALHPDYLFFWNEIDREQLFSLFDWIAHGQIVENKLLLPYTEQDRERFGKGKRALELIGCEHARSIEHIIVGTSKEALLFNLGVNGCDLDAEIDKCMQKLGEKRNELSLSAFQIVQLLCPLIMRDLSGTFIGARMGRPEKAKLRKLDGSPHILFPVGEEGGRLRSMQAAMEAGSVSSDFPNFFCEKCSKETIYPSCETCRERCRTLYYCRECMESRITACEQHASFSFQKKRVDSKYYVENACKRLGFRMEELPAVIKGVRGTSNKEHYCEHMGKGILRARHNLHVNKDGTIRYDMTEMPLTHFKPEEIGTSVTKLREMGYERDVYGKELERTDQLLSLMPHDIILPACPNSPDEKANDVFLRVATFIDQELVRLYGQEPALKVEKKDDLIGLLFACIAPHTCSAVVGRLIGFSQIQALLASPYLHAAMRRDCFDYDTYLPIKEANEWKITKIGELVERLHPIKQADAFGTKEVSVTGFKAIGSNGKLREVSINNFTKHPLNEMIEIKTSLGKKIRVTENHKFLIEGKTKRASDLMIGDKLPLPSKIEITSKKLEEINLLYHLKDENLMIRKVVDIIGDIKQDYLLYTLKKTGISKRQFYNFMSRDSFPIEFILQFNCDILEEIARKGMIATKRDSVETPIIIKLNKELLEVIGLYIAEGYSRSLKGRKGLNQVYIASSEKEIRDFVKKTIFKSFGLRPTERKTDRVTFSSRVLYLFFNKVLKAGCIAREKRIPSSFLNLELEKLACILRGYFEGDGSAEKKRKKVCCDSVSEGLLYDLEFCLSRFGIFAKRYEYEKEPGPKVREFYVRKRRDIPKFKITKLIICSSFVDNYKSIGFLSRRKKSILKSYSKIKEYGMRVARDENFVYDPIVSIDYIGERESYCLNVNSQNHLVLANSIVSKQCDGDEAAVILLHDLLLNFSRKFLPSHRGGTQDAPLVLNVRIKANEVDDMIFDLDVGKEIPLKLYEAAGEHNHPAAVEMETVRNRLGTGKEFKELWFSAETSNINNAPLCSSYKSLPTMAEKVGAMMELCTKIRAVDVDDVGRLIIERHFIRDIRGNLRKFSQQVFRCVQCNDKYRRPPLTGKCTHCGGRLIFTISEGSILKYMQPALDLARKYNVSPYLLESLELTEMYIQSIFGKEKEKQESIKKWF